MKKLDNRGFTLTELIVVIAILGILAGSLTASVGQIFSNQTRKFVNDFDALLSRCRVEILSGAPINNTDVLLDTNVELGPGNDGQYYVVYRKGGVVKEEQSLPSKNAVCSFVPPLPDSETEATIIEGKSLFISFDRRTGAMKMKYGTVGNDGTFSGDSVTVTQINIAGQKITLEPMTGYHSIGG